MITIILSIIGWTFLARQVRGRILAMKTESYTMAAVVAGAGDFSIIRRHMLPGLMSHIIAALTLRIPAMILAETALSFLGIGLRPPVISWGVLLQEAQNISSIALHPWLFAPAFFVIAAVLSFNFLGDGLRDAADPYGRA
jgi:peptide/nickel transport system permease protein